MEIPAIGSRLRHVRVAKGLTQYDLQARMKVGRAYLSRTESGKCTPTLDTLDKWCSALGISISDLFLSDNDFAEKFILVDPFMRVAAPYLLNLTFRQREQVLEVLQDLSGKPHTNSGAERVRGMCDSNL